MSEDNYFHRHRLLQDHRRWCRASSNSRQVHYLKYMCAITLLAVTVLITITNTTSTSTRQYSNQLQQKQHVVADEHPADDQNNITHTAAPSRNTHLHKKQVNNTAQERLELRGWGKGNSHNRHVNNESIAEDDVTAYHDEPHNYGILLTHYHKTGYVLSRHLMKLVIDLEYRSRGMSTPLESANTTQAKISIKMHKTIDHFDKSTGVQIAFGQRGNWNRNFVPARRHSAITGCPPSFTLDVGAMHVQEAPDLFCRDEELYRLLFGIGEGGENGGDSWKELFQHLHSTRSHRINNTSSSSQSTVDNGDGDTGYGHDVVSGKGGVKIVHFVRNPFDMAISNYLYHSQDPSPERWVHIDDPCEFRYDSSGRKSLASFVLPLLSSKTKITSRQLDAIVALCHSLYQSNSTSSSVSDINLENATFYEHLMNLNRLDGLRLATAQMVISSSTANNHLAGGDILRMGQNILQFENLRTLLSSTSEPLSTIPMIERSSFHLLTLSMEDFMASANNTTLQFLNFVLGDDGHNNTAVLVPKDLRVKAAEEFESSTIRSKNRPHITQGKHDDREELIQSLREDSALGPVLSEIEVLVEGALRKSL